MDCSSGNSSGSLCEQIVVQNQSSGSEAELKQLMDQRKRKRMQSNRESARRSRMRKQQHLDGLMAQVSQLRDNKNQMISRINLTTQLFLNIEAENSVLRAQILELTHRLESLNQILSHINNNDDDEQQQRQQQHNNNFLQDFCDNFDEFDLNPLFINSLFFTPQQQQPPIMASAHHHLLHY
ncbi:bZIP transcription factor 53-like [Cucumis melo var. makuwa]|uniref:BZIP transcription factor 11-like n=2 Tax=Cucumis melo TaxID=3656 RepID=A0A1S3CRH5_CUCME|nr:bZIP transcription factor 11-like [Cucumis melo]KAA0063223.1 bZIP transcription factor 53-like [Cucumis melo var. makuwa]TYK13473.1 bZIP transcription factor 53-like [Cucumis melo var. makuwa]